MKIFCFIFALYITALAVYPCYEDDCVEEFSLSNNANQDDHEKEDADLCTPFCISTCCAVHAFCTPNFDAITISQNSVAENSTYTLTFIPPVVVPIWQPPKLA